MYDRSHRKNKLHNVELGYNWMHHTTSAEDLELQWKKEEYV